MASDDKKHKATPAAKTETPAKDKTEAPPKDKSTTGADTAKADAGETAAAAPTSYSRGEGQKPITKTYRDNWNAIFGKKKKR